MKYRALSLIVPLLGMQFASYAQSADLMDAYHAARENDMQFQAAQSWFGAQEEQVPQAKSVLLPQLSLSGSSTANHDHEDGDHYNQNSATLSLSQTLYNAAQGKAYRQAQVQLKIEQAQLKQSEQEFLLRIAERYFNLLNAKLAFDFAEAEEKAIAQQHALVRKKFEVGQSAITDLREAEADLDLTRATLIQQRNQLELSQRALHEITGEQWQKLNSLSESQTLPEPKERTIQQWLEDALQQNPDMIMAQQKVKKARQEVARKRDGHKPTLNLTGSYKHSDMDSGSSGDSRAGSIGLELSIPLYSGGNTSSKVREAQQLFQQAQQQLIQTRRAVELAVETAVLNLNAEYLQAKALKRALHSSETALAATQKGFEAGTRNTVDVLNARKNHFQTQRDYAQARHNYLLSSIKLEKAVGSLAPTHLEAINRFLAEEISL